MNRLLEIVAEIMGVGVRLVGVYGLGLAFMILATFLVPGSLAIVGVAFKAKAVIATAGILWMVTTFLAGLAGINAATKANLSSYGKRCGFVLASEGAISTICSVVDVAKNPTASLLALVCTGTLIGISVWANTDGSSWMNVAQNIAILGLFGIVGILAFPNTFATFNDKAADVDSLLHCGIFSTKSDCLATFFDTSQKPRLESRVSREEGVGLDRRYRGGGFEFGAWIKLDSPLRTSGIFSLESGGDQPGKSIRAYADERGKVQYDSTLTSCAAMVVESDESGYLVPDEWYWFEARYGVVPLDGSSSRLVIGVWPGLTGKQPNEEVGKNVSIVVVGVPVSCLRGNWQATFGSVSRPQAWWQGFTDARTPFLGDMIVNYWNYSYAKVGFNNEPHPASPAP